MMDLLHFSAQLAVGLRPLSSPYSLVSYELTPPIGVQPARLKCLLFERRFAGIVALQP